MNKESRQNESISKSLQLKMQEFGQHELPRLRWLSIQFCLFYTSAASSCHLSSYLTYLLLIFQYACLHPYLLSISYPWRPCFLTLFNYFLLFLDLKTRLAPFFCSFYLIYGAIWVLQSTSCFLMSCLALNSMGYQIVNGIRCSQLSPIYFLFHAFL